MGNQTQNVEFNWNPSSQFQNFCPFQYHSVPTVHTPPAPPSQTMWFDETVQFEMENHQNPAGHPLPCPPHEFQPMTSFDGMLDISVTEQLLQDPEEFDNSLTDFLVALEQI